MHMTKTGYYMQDINCEQTVIKGGILAIINYSVLHKRFTLVFGTRYCRESPRTPEKWYVINCRSRR